MTETATEGSVAESAVADSPAGNPETQTPSEAANGSTAETGGFLDGLSEDNRRVAEAKGWKTPEDIDKVFSSYRELERAQGDALRVPKDDAPPEEWDKFYSRLPEGLRPPEAPDKYEFKRPEGLPEDLPYSDELADASKSWMHEAKVGPKQAQVLHDKFAQYMADQQKAAQAQLAEAVEATHADLTKEWGPVGSEGFQRNHAYADRAIKGLGLSESFKKAGILLPDGSLTDPQIARAFAVYGEDKFAEDTIGNDPVAVGGNPFKLNDSGQRDIGGISQLVRSDPARAARLAREAGEDPRAWGISVKG